MRSNRKITFIDLSLMISGSQKVTLSILDELIKEGYTVTSIIRNKKGEVLDSYTKKCKVNFFWFESLISYFFCSGTFSYSKVGFLNKIKLFFLLLSMNFQVILYSLRNGSKIIYCYDPKGIVSCGLLAKLFGFKLVWHLHGELNFPTIINKVMIALSSNIIVPSEYIKNSLPENTKTKLIYNGFDFKHIDALKIPMGDENCLRIVYAGTIVPHKGLHLLLDKLSVCKIGNIELTVLGTPVGKNGHKYFHYVKSLSHSLPSNISVTFEGWVTDPFPYFSYADVTAFTSVKCGTLVIEDEVINFRSSEALPTSVIESLSIGTPVVAFDIAGVKEIITDCNDGYILPENNFDLIECLYLAKKNCRVDKLKTINKFRKENMIKKFIEILK